MSDVKTAIPPRKDYLSPDSHRRDSLSGVKTAIMDAAERRMQLGGFGGFSFREIAADVGIKSSSVHYHFPTKEDLAAAVIRRWAEETSKFIDEELEKDPDPVRAWTNAFRGTALSEGRMCPCTVLGAASLSPCRKGVLDQARRSCCAMGCADHVDESAQSGRNLPVARIIQKESLDGWRPVLQHTDQLA